ncbi:acetyl-CoA acetyltransferase A, mitochondrial [Pieris rapae]|uniref:acetyl-CoA acetyltransferase A, mitochondrial n=1 Tax=Pieris rapae TaxID=64459 RepID=UPI000B92AC34|nr:acetyl-CoA acetyltransferase A, mitochondrial [Pieris rapae]
MSKIVLSEVVIVSAVRTPIGCFQGRLSTLTATELGGIAIKGAVERAHISPEEVQEVFIGNVCSAYLRQAPARQAAINGGLPASTVCTTINKVCSSGLKAVTLAAQALQTRTQDVVLAGGIESMSNVPFYLRRGDTPYGGLHLVDGILYDGLTDVEHNIHMGDCGEYVANKFEILRCEQDDHAIDTYRRTIAAYEANVFAEEMIPVTVPQRKGAPIIVAEDDEYKRFNFETFRKLQPVFQKGGTITAGNSAGLNDGGAAVLMMTSEAADRLKVEPLARVVGYADAERDPLEFPIAPADAVTKLLEKTGVSKESVALWEINEPFSMVGIANRRILGLEASNVNVHGSSVSLGHPLGMSGTRLVAHLSHVLRRGQLGVATTCNGGGGATALMIEKI